jgi:hypothetical protein
VSRQAWLSMIPLAVVSLLIWVAIIYVGAWVLA